ncbi:SixA phosphatase family protein [Thalassotalea litorea]|uniref:SixA phosphatase family protein n=1 Tax=Thalassotalea litorea TaxID=2020715 RepID=UPI003736275F
MPNTHCPKPIALALIGFCVFLAILQSDFAFASENKTDGSYTIYLIRHAEKQKRADDPPLTECGHLRAKKFAEDFSATPLLAIYSSDYHRTQQTAAPVASQKNLTIQSYNPAQLQDIANRLLDQRQTALVVGHSNTTAVLAGILSSQHLTEFSETEYDRIYKVEISNQQQKLTLTRQAFNCH